MLARSIAMALFALLALARATPSSAQDAPGTAPVLANPSPYLNPLLIFENGSAVATKAAWRERRTEVSRLSQEVTTHWKSALGIRPPATGAVAFF